MSKSAKSIESMSLSEIIEAMLVELKISKAFSDQVERISNYYSNLPDGIRKSLRKYFETLPVSTQKEKGLATIIQGVVPFFTLLISVAIASLGVVGTPAMIGYYDFIIKNGEYIEMAKESFDDSIRFSTGLMNTVGALALLAIVFIGIDMIFKVNEENKNKRLTIIKSIIESIDDKNFD